MNVAVAVPLAVCAAATFAVSSALQQRAARAAPEAETLSWRLIADLLQRPIWLLGMTCVVIAFAFQAAALDFAPVALVEPIIATELVLALPLAARLGHRRLGSREWFAAIAVSGGVAIFLATSSPRGGDSEPGLTHWAIVAGPVLFVAGCAIVLARGPESPRRAALLGSAAGLCFGLLSLVTQSFVVLLSRNAATAFTSWQPYVLAALGCVSFTVAQSAYQTAPLAYSLPIIDSLEPTTAVVLAAVAFGQSLSLDASALASECVGCVLAVTGLVLLGRSPLIHSFYEQQQARKAHEAA
jgi:drug/metabolite transporter (DMT)-like permease